MPIKTYRGSCHCQAIRYEVDVDLSAGTGKCNCTFCWKARNWSVQVKPEAFRLLSGQDALSTYQFNTHSTAHGFCKRCGVRTHSAGDIAEIGGEFVSIALASLDDASPDELVTAPLTHMDGRRDNWWNAPAETRHL